jgi:hypothetical protein
MKTERRHELQTNVLASSLAHWIKAAQPYSRAALAAAIALVVALFAWAYLSTQNTRRVADGWNEYFEAVNGRNPDAPELLRDIATRYSGTEVADWARLTLAEQQLVNGTNLLLQDRKRARDELNEASQKFLSLIPDTTNDTILERATYGLAQAYETQGRLEQARSAYRDVAAQWPNGPFAKVAEARAKDLDQLPTKNFYDWLAKYEPPSVAKEPGTPGAKPDFLSEPDAGKMLKLPPAGTPILPSLTDEPASGESKPEQPASATPADKPAEESQPSDAKPAEEATPADNSTPPEPAPNDSGPKLP